MEECLISGASWGLLRTDCINMPPAAIAAYIIDHLTVDDWLVLKSTHHDTFTPQWIRTADRIAERFHLAPNYHADSRTSYGRAVEILNVVIEHVQDKK